MTLKELLDQLTLAKAAGASDDTQIELEISLEEQIVTADLVDIYYDEKRELIRLGDYDYDQEKDEDEDFDDEEDEDADEDEGWNDDEEEKRVDR